MSNPPRQSHLDWLLSTIESEPDPAVSRLAPLLRESRKLFQAGAIKEQHLREGLVFLKLLTMQTAIAGHRTRTLLDATIEYIINPNLTIKDHLRS